MRNLYFDINQFSENQAYLELKRYGFIIFRNLFNAMEMEVLEHSFKTLKEDIKNKKESQELIISSQKQPYNVLAKSQSSVADIRGDQEEFDNNFIDVFNPHHWLKENFPESEEICKKVNHHLFLSLTKKYSPEMLAKNSNIYFHDGVTNPRTHHIDSVKPYFKIFLAVSDQSDLKCGPFAVIPGSHKQKIKNYLMCQVNSKILRKKGSSATDAIFYRQADLKPLLLLPGEVAFCDQTIVHGAMPAFEGGMRTTFVQTYNSNS